jgi:hypothetical protein
MRRCGVGIADVVRAATALRPNRAALAALVEMCGMALLRESQDERSGPPAVTEDVDLDEPADDQPPVSVVPSDQSLPASVRRLQPVRQRRPQTATTDPLARAAAQPAPPATVFEGLLTMRDGAELLRLATSVPMATDEIDIELVAHDLAYARPLTKLPRLYVPSLAFGAQVLADVGRPMQPFFEDQDELLGRFVRNMRDRVDILYYADDPERGAGSERRKGSWKPYAPPLPGTPVIALTDLGCGFPERANATRAWLRLAARLRRQHSRAVVFAPVRLTRIPPELRRVTELVSWDRSAVRRNVMQLAGGGR